MTNKCLVTRLKAAIQNDELPLFNTIKLRAVATPTTISTITDVYKLEIGTNDDGVTIKVDGDGYFAETYENLSDPNMRYTEMYLVNTTNRKKLYFHNSNYNVYIQDANNLNSIYLYATGTGITNVKRTLLELDLNEFRNISGLKQCSLSYSNSYGDISNIPSTVTNFSCASTTITGDISSLANKCIFDGSKRFIIYSTGITGSVEDFVNGQVSLGSIENTISARGLLSQLSFGSVKYMNYGNVLYWAGVERIFVGESKTSQNPTNFDICETIYAKGATAEEIAQWEEDGKTVVVITD